MLTIIVPAVELFDEVTETFTTLDEIKLELEHSLVSLSKWEAEFEKPFLTAGEKSTQEIIAYIKAMILTPDFPPEVLLRFSSENITQVQQYIDSKQSATTINDIQKGKGRSEIITSELIYYWMVGFNIPFECQYWHLNRLFSLIRICNVKNQKPKKMTRAEMAQQNRELNRQRREQLGTRG